MSDDLFIWQNYVANRFFVTYPGTLTRGDRVRIKDGYDGAGDVCYFIAKSATKKAHVLVDVPNHTGGICCQECLLADAIEPYPYTREERIERAIEEFADLTGLHDEFYHTRAILFAFLDEGV